MSKTINKLKAFRLSKGLTQKELAEKLGIHQEQICYIETGRRRRFKEINKNGCNIMEMLKKMGYNDSVTDDVKVSKLSKEKKEMILNYLL